MGSAVDLTRLRRRVIKLMPGRSVGAAVMAASLIVPLCAACGSDTGGPVNLNMYAFADGATEIAKRGHICSARSKGRYHITTISLPKAADDQRLQLARRLTGNDTSLDLMGLDVVWTAEFAEAGWAVPLPARVAAEVSKDVLGGPLTSAMWKGRLYAAPTWTNTQLLWYRKDLVDKYLGGKVPTTWDQMVADTKVFGQHGAPTWIVAQGKQYEGLMVWFNSILASAGGAIVDENGKVLLNDTPQHRAATVKALRVLRLIATAPGHDPSISNSDEASARLAMENGSAGFEVNWPFVFPSMRSNAVAGAVKFLPELKGQNPDAQGPQLAQQNADVRKVFDFARYPGVVEGQPSKVTLGGLNIAVAKTSQHKDLAFEALMCLRSRAAQKQYAISGGTPPTIASLYDDKDFQQAYPAWKLIRTQLELQNAALRPKSPAYQAISTLLVADLSPVGQFDPNTLVDRLAEQVRRAINGEGLIP